LVPNTAGNVFAGLDSIRHACWSIPALAVGLAFTVSTTSSVAVPQDGEALLVVVNFNVTVPIPETFTPLVNEVGLVIEALAVPVDPVCVHKNVPLVPVPANVNAVGPEGAV
jgi:hypothetical protein